MRRRGVEEEAMEPTFQAADEEMPPTNTMGGDDEDGQSYAKQPAFIRPSPLVVAQDEEEDDSPMPMETFLRDFFQMVETQMSEVALDVSKRLAKHALHEAEAVAEVNASIIRATQHISDTVEYGLLDATYLTLAHAIFNPAQSRHCDAVTVQGAYQLKRYFGEAYLIVDPDIEIAEIECRHTGSLSANVKSRLQVHTKYVLATVCEMHRKELLLMRGFEAISQIKLLLPAATDEEDPDVVMYAIFLRRGV